MKRSRSALPQQSFDALARVRRALRDAVASGTPPPAAAPVVQPSPDGPWLFRRAVADVIPLAPDNRADILRPRARPVARQRLRDEQQVMVDALSDPWDWDAATSTGEELMYARPGIPTATLRKLRRGGWVIQAELDLHGHTGDEARVALAAFLNRCRLEDRRCVRVIHGKGHGSKNRLPVLKHKVRHWLMQREDVLAFCQARTVDGGAGAAIVLLKSYHR